MKRRSITALILAAVLAVGGTGEAAAVFGADFQEAEVFADSWADSTVEDESMAEEEDVWGDLEFTDGSSVEIQDAAPIFGDGEQEIFSGEEQSYGIYVGGFVTAEQYRHWQNTGEAPEDFVQDTSSSVTLTEFLRQMKDSGNNTTGICLIGTEQASGTYEDLVIPQGIQAGIMSWDQQLKLKNITAEGSVQIRAFVETPGTLIINPGSGDTGFLESDVIGDIRGEGNCAVSFYGWNTIGGMHNVPTCTFRNSEGINVKGSIEFYDLFNDREESISVNIQGTNPANVPIFHKEFDFGMSTDTDENGNLISWPNGIGIGFVENMDTEDWKFINPTEGMQTVRFEMPDTSVLTMREKVWPNCSDESQAYLIDMDGTVYVESSLKIPFHVQRFVGNENFSAKEAYDDFYVKEFDERNIRWAGSAGTLDNAVRLIRADQEAAGQGYYALGLVKDFTATETITVPDNITGLKLVSCEVYDEATNTANVYPAKLTGISVPQGKEMGLVHIKNSSGTLNITGEGKTVLINCRLNQQVNANTVEIHSSTIKSLNCHTLLIFQDNLVIGEYLKFNTAVLADAQILAKSPAYLYMGTVDNVTTTGTNGTSFALFQEIRSGKKADIYLSEGLNLGTVSYDDGSGPAIMEVIPYDYAAAAKAGASFTKDCYALDFNIWDGGMDPIEFRGEYDNSATRLMTIRGSAAKDFTWEAVAFNYNHDKFLQARVLVRDEFDPADDGITADGKYLTFYGDEKGLNKTQAYFQVTEDGARKYLAGATVASIKNQIYTGKALKPSVTVKFDGVTLKNNADYTLSYKNNTKPGTATVTITGKGKYTGTLIKTFKIVYPVPAKGKVFTVGNLKYTVTKSASSNGTVSVTAPAKKTYTSITIPSTVKIKGYTFKVTAIAAKAFKSNTKLKTLTIGANIASVGKEAFYGCKALKTITVKSSCVKSVGANAWKGIYKKAVIKVPSSKLTAYKKLFKGKGQSSTVKITK